MIVNYDKKNGWSSVFDGGIASFFKGNLNKNDASFVKNIKAIQNSLGTISSKNIDRLANSIGGVNQELIDSAKAVRSGKQTWTDFDNTVVSVTQSTSKFSSLTSKAKSALKSFGSSVLSMGANMLAGFAVGTVISGVIEGIQYLATYNERMAESARNITSSWDESNASLNDQISKYKELKSQLDSGTLTPDEEYSTRQQILDIQSQITSQYGEQAEGVSLVNGNLEQQLAILQNIAAENAKTTLNKSREEYDNVMNQMTKNREYDLGAFGSDIYADSSVQNDILAIAREYEDAGLQLKKVIDETTGQDTGAYTITFEGDASQADKTITDFMNRVSDLEEKYAGDEFATNVINRSVDAASGALSKNQEILDDYQESYNKFLQMEMLSEGYGEGSVADTYNKYAEAVQKYNEALASGDSDSINKARADFHELNNEVDTLLTQGDNDKFTSLFDEVGDSLDEASIKLNDFNEALAGKAGDSNTFKDTADDIKAASDELKEMKLDAQEVRDALITDGAQTGEDQIFALADAWGLTEESIENQDEAFTEFLSILSEAGIITGQVASATDTAAASYDAFSSTVQTATENLNTLQSIMSESVSGSGISDENVKALREIFGSDLDLALEKTANGYHLNKEALAELQAQQETLTKSDYLSALSDQYELLAENSEKLAKAQFQTRNT